MDMDEAPPTSDADVRISKNTLPALMAPFLSFVLLFSHLCVIFNPFRHKIPLKTQTICLHNFLEPEGFLENISKLSMFTKACISQPLEPIEI